MFLLNFPHFKNKIKSKWRLQATPFLTGGGFFKTGKLNCCIHSFHLKASRVGPEDQVRVHKLATLLGIEPRISGFIRRSNLNLSWVYRSTWFFDQWTLRLHRCLMITYLVGIWLTPVMCCCLCVHLLDSSMLAHC